MTSLQLEMNAAFVAKNPAFRAGDAVLLVTPPIDTNYWLLRVKVSEHQAIVAFPKFFTIGIGFQVEEDWNTNLPYTCPAEEIFRHIAHNKGDDQISDADCIAAIELVQAEVRRISGE